MQSTRDSRWRVVIAKVVIAPIAHLTSSSCLIRQQMSALFFNTLFNLHRYVAFEQRDPHRIAQMHAHPDLTYESFVLFPQLLCCAASLASAANLLPPGPLLPPYSAGVRCAWLLLSIIELAGTQLFVAFEFAASGTGSRSLATTAFRTATAVRARARVLAAVAAVEA